MANLQFYHFFSPFSHKRCPKGSLRGNNQYCFSIVNNFDASANRQNKIKLLFPIFVKRFNQRTDLDFFRVKAEIRMSHFLKNAKRADFLVYRVLYFSGQLTHLKLCSIAM